MSDYKVTIPSPEEAAEAIARMRAGGPLNLNARRKLALAGGVELKGSFELTARDAESGEVAWQHEESNLITDFGRRAWMDLRFSGMAIGFCPSTEAPISGRCALGTDPAQCVISGNLTPTNNTTTHTKTVSATYVVPSVNRTLGTIFIFRHNDILYTQSGPGSMIAYALLTPPKTQTTTQTLEVVYKISMSPIA